MRNCWLVMVIGMLLAAPLPAATYYGAHLTAQPPWINRIDVYNNENAPGTFTLAVWDSQGQLVSQQEYPVGANAVASVVLPTDPGCVPAAGEIVLPAVEGVCAVTTASPRVRPKLSFRYGASLSLCEFFMQESLAWEYVLPNTIQAHFIGTGLAVQNPFETALAVRLRAFRQGEQVGDTGPLEIAPHAKLVSISEGFWPGVGSGDFDLVRISSAQAAFPAPISITWDQLQDRHVFFNAAPTATNPSPQPGDVVETDSIVGDLVFIPAGTFTQGSPTDEPCRWSREAQFSHTLTRPLAVMETEVTRQMWAALLAAQPTLPADPTNTVFGAGMDNPVQRVTWYEAVLFANLLSLQQGRTRCYYADDAFTIPVDASNYTTEPFYCDFAASGYRLLSEGEWEYACRAGTATPFWIAEPNYTAVDCGTSSPGLFAALETAAWFLDNSSSLNASSPVGTKAPNPWGLYDTHGNVWEYCWDWYETYPSGSSEDHAGPSSGSLRVFRGGDWYNNARFCRAAQRDGLPPGNRYNSVGFRLVRTIG